MCERSLILIVDGDNDVAASMRIRLEHAGYDVCFAENVTANVEAASSCIPDAVLLDVHSPCVDWHEVMRTLNNPPTTNRIPIIACAPQAGLRKIANSMGAVAFVPKPYTASQLVGGVQHALANAKQLNQNGRRDPAHADLAIARPRHTYSTKRKSNLTNIC